MMMLEKATAYAGQMYGVDAFNQPGVELGKQFAYALLGRPGARSRAKAVGRASQARSPLVSRTLNSTMTKSQTEQLFDGAVEVRDGAVTVSDPSKIAGEHLDALVRKAVFAEGDERDDARWLIWEIAQSVGIHPSSIHDLYIARGKGAYDNLTVPAINVRGMAYDTARSIFRTANKLGAGAFVLEIARSEIAYTDQRPAEYASVMLAAALREGFRGPLFIQGDHFQISAKKFATNPEQEAGRSEAARDRGHRSRLLQHRHRHIDAGRHHACNARRAAEREREAVRATSQHTFAQGSLPASRSRSAARSARSAPRTARPKSCAPTWTVSTRCSRRKRPAPTGFPRSACSPEPRTAASCSPTARSRT